MSLRSPLGRVKGLGSAKTGLTHWQAQRLTALSLVPLGLWFIYARMGVIFAPFEAVVAWIASPVVTVL
ncbi:MAG: succinate dehydrogenase, hydrophobic membrane anchor protein, partial [Gammaproteobacteria bacterium]